MKKAILFITMLSVILTGCQKTPEESAVASKENGLSQDVIAKPLKNGEKQELEVPEHWKFSEKRSDDRVTISADLELGTMEVGNLPVIERKRHELTEAELKELVAYFAGKQELFEPHVSTKEFYENIIDRIENPKENDIQSERMGDSKYQNLIKEAYDLAPENAQDKQVTDVKFQMQKTDAAIDHILENQFGIEIETNEEEDYFDADVGADGKSMIRAERYNKKLENESLFEWKQKGWWIDESDVEIYRRMNQMEGAETDKLNEILLKYQTKLDELSFDQKEGKEKADAILDDLEIRNMQLCESKKILWFEGEDAYRRFKIGLEEENFAQCNADECEEGYLYSYSFMVEGIPAKQSLSFGSLQETPSYIPAFSLETINIIVTKSGVKSFIWNSMTDEVKMVAENTKFADFEKIQEQIINQIYYRYAMRNQPANDQTKIRFDIVDMDLKYTYIPAYENPQNTWLIPAWFFVVDAGDFEPEPLKYTLNALDGGVIGNQ